MNKILMIIAPVNFRDEELFVPKEFFESKNLEVDVASLVKTPVTGMLKKTVTPDLLISEIVLDEYDAVVFVGGIGVEDRKLYENHEILGLARSSFSKGKVVGAICIAPKILAAAGLLKNKEATVFRSGKDYIIEKGAEFTDEDAIRDGMIITASGPQAAEKFANLIYELLQDN